MKSVVVGITNNVGIKTQPDTKRGERRDGFGLHMTGGRRAANRRAKAAQAKAKA